MISSGSSKPGSTASTMRAQRRPAPRPRRRRRRRPRGRHVGVARASASRRCAARRCRRRARRGSRGRRAAATSSPGRRAACSTFIISAASATLIVCGPRCDTVPNGDSGYAGTRPKLGLSPTLPQNAAGMRTDPAPSVPTPSGPQPGGDGRRRAARRPAGRLRRVPRVAGDAGQRRVGLALAAELGRRRLADQHGAGLAQAGRRRRVDVPRLVGVDGPAAPPRRPAPGQDEVLDRRRHAVERADRLAALPARLARRRRRQRLVGGDEAEGVDRRVDAPRCGRARRAVASTGDAAPAAVQRRAARSPCTASGRAPTHPRVPSECCVCGVRSSSTRTASNTRMKSG